MAVSVDAINAVTKRKFIPKLEDNITTSNAYLMKVPKTTVDGGTDIRVPTIYAYNSAGGWYAGSEQHDTAANEKKTALVFEWKQLYQFLSISGLDQIKNAGESKVIDHVKSEVQIAEMTMKNLFGTGMYSDGTNTKSIVGARVFCSQSNTYGGIDQGAESWLQSQLDATTTALTVGKMQELFESCTEDNDHPTLITTTSTLFNSYYAKLQPLQRYSDSDLGKGGFRNLLFNGVPVVSDSYCPSSHMFMLNLKYIELKSSTARKFPGKFVPFKEFDDQDSTFAKFYWAGAKTCSSPRKSGAFTALTS